MRRSPVFQDSLLLLNADSSGAVKEIDLGYLTELVAAYAITIDNSPVDAENDPVNSVAISLKLLNKEVFKKANDSFYESWVDLATIDISAGERGTVLVNGLYIGEGTKAIVTLGASPTVDYDLAITIREVK